MAACGELRAVVAGLVVVTLGEGDAAPDLLLEVAQRPGERGADEVVQALVVEVARAEVAGEEHRAQVLDDADDRVARGQHDAPAGELREPLRLLAQRVDHRGERDEVDGRRLRGAHFASSKSQVER